MSLPFPASIADFQAVFPDDDACREWLLACRWPDGFRCPVCGRREAWRRSSARLVCQGCRRETSITAGTALHRSRLPLTIWFWSAYLVATQPGMNARTLGRTLGIASHKTRWHVLERLRRSMGLLDFAPLEGVVEADEMALGGFAPGKRGFAGDNKTTVLVLVQRGSPRTRLVIVPDRRGATLVPAIERLVRPGSTMITDGHDGYLGLPAAGFAWTRIPHPRGGLARGAANRATPAADGVTSRFKRWLLGTYNKPPADLAPYLAEFCFRTEFRDNAQAAFSTLLGLAMTTPPTDRPSLGLGRRQ
ncbi:MAG TPA: IS1595 family transposase [Candidatus Saccharimonadales bacterium]|nr:IS1595 family transposase [Candidatus Saccharimonadales bacterium]